jgi:hypothetical protein
MYEKKSSIRCVFKQKNGIARKVAWRYYCKPHETENRKQDLYHEKGEGEEKSSHVVHEMMGTI